MAPTGALQVICYPLRITTTVSYSTNMFILFANRFLLGVTFWQCSGSSCPDSITAPYFIYRPQRCFQEAFYTLFDTDKWRRWWRSGASLLGFPCPLLLAPAGRSLPQRVRHKAGDFQLAKSLWKSFTFQPWIDYSTFFCPQAKASEGRCEWYTIQKIKHQDVAGGHQGQHGQGRPPEVEIQLVFDFWFILTRWALNTENSAHLQPEDSLCVPIKAFRFDSELALKLWYFDLKGLFLRFPGQIVQWQ